MESAIYQSFNPLVPGVHKKVTAAGLFKYV